MIVPPDFAWTREGAVGVLSLDRPARRNAVTRAMWLALPGLAEAVAREEGLRVLILRGAGREAFSAGADIAEFPEAYADAAAAGATNDAVRDGLAAVAAIPIPVLALVHGACMGGGLALALAADLRFASGEARFGLPPARLGLAYPFAETKALADLIGPARVLDLLFSARSFGAAEALAMGLVERVLPAEDVDGAAAAWAAEVAALSPASIRVAKRMVRAIRAGAVEPDADLRAAYDATFTGPDLAEGIRAFREKRRPDFAKTDSGGKP